MNSVSNVRFGVYSPEKRAERAKAALLENVQKMQPQEIKTWFEEQDAKLTSKSASVKKKAKEDIAELAEALIQVGTLPQLQALDVVLGIIPNFVVPDTMANQLARKISDLANPPRRYSSSVKFASSSRRYVGGNNAQPAPSARPDLKAALLNMLKQS